MEAFAQRTPPSREREGEEVFRLLVELTARITSSAPSQLNNDQSSSLNPLIASLKPLQKENYKNMLQEF